MMHGSFGNSKRLGKFLEGVTPRGEELENAQPPLVVKRLVESHQRQEDMKKYS
jgi:hypothetical protein